MTQGMAAAGLLPVSTSAGTNRAHECHYPLPSKDPYVTLGQIQILRTDTPSSLDWMPIQREKVWVLVLSYFHLLD